MMVAQLYKFTKNSVVQWLNLWYVSYSFKNQGLSPPPQGITYVLSCQKKCFKVCGLYELIEKDDLSTFH